MSILLERLYNQRAQPAGFGPFSSFRKPDTVIGDSHPAALLIDQAVQGDRAAIAPGEGVFQGVGEPVKAEATSDRIAEIKAPDGFAVKPFATGLKNARIIAVAPNGDIYVSRREQGDVLLLKDVNSDGVADGEPIAVAHRPGGV